MKKSLTLFKQIDGLTYFKNNYTGQLLEKENTEKAKKQCII